MLVLTNFLLGAVWVLNGLSAQDGTAGMVVAQDIYEFLLGAMVLIQLAIHVRHLKNFFLFRAMKTGQIRGRIEYPRPTVLKLSSTDLLTFAGIFMLLSLIFQNWFFAGGVLACLSAAAQHFRKARKIAAMPQPAIESQQA